MPVYPEVRSWPQEAYVLGCWPGRLFGMCYPGLYICQSDFRFLIGIIVSTKNFQKVQMELFRQDCGWQVAQVELE